jgi:hypothetical protein
MKICIVTILIGDLSYKEDARKNHEVYCKKHNYDYLCITEPLNDYHPMWMKPDVILLGLQRGYDYVFWMDGDSFFMNMDISLMKFVDLDMDLVATGDHNDIVNTGHLLFRNSDWSHKFMEEWKAFRKPLTPEIYEQFKQITTHFIYNSNSIYFNDQPPFNMLLAGASASKPNYWFEYFNAINLYENNSYRLFDINYAPICKKNLERANGLIHQKFREYVKIVNQREMNSYSSNYRKGDFILHLVEDKNYASFSSSLSSSSESKDDSSACFSNS